MKERVRQIVLDLGADVCGIAGIERFSGAPAGFHPADVFPACQSAVIFLKKYPAGLRDVSPRQLYIHANDLLFDVMDNISFSASVKIEEELGGRAVPVPCDTPYEYWDAENLEGRGLLSMRHAAMLAGLGHLGRSTLLIHPELGNMVMIGALLTDLPLESDPLCETTCPPGCRICLDGCPVGALDGTTISQKRCRPYVYTKNARGYEVCNCNLCRVRCPQALGKRKGAAI